MTEFFSGVFDNLTLFFMKLVSGKLKEEVREKQYESNMEQWKIFLEDDKKLATIATDIRKTMGGKKYFYIERQYLMKEILYGEKKGFIGKLIFKDSELTAADNACEVIAVFNALMSMGEIIPLPELLKHFSGGGIALKGMFGTDFTRLQKYFDSQGFDTVRINGNKITPDSLEKIGNDYSAFLFMAFNEGQNPSSMLHTMCISKERKDRTDFYMRHNSGNMKLYDNLYEAVTDYNGGKGHAVSVIGVRN